MEPPPGGGDIDQDRVDRYKGYFNTGNEAEDRARLEQADFSSAIPGVGGPLPPIGSAAGIPKAGRVEETPLTGPEEGSEEWLSLGGPGYKPQTNPYGDDIGLPEVIPTT